MYDFVITACWYFFLFLELYASLISDVNSFNHWALLQVIYFNLINNLNESLIKITLVIPFEAAAALLTG